MKRTLALISFIMINSIAHAQTSSRCLEEATDRQLVNEIERRLYLGGGEDSGAIANFFCDANGYFTISLVNQAGRQASQRIYVGDTTVCRETRAELVSVASVNRLTIVAVCNSNSYLYRYTLRPDGTIAELDRRYVGSMETCIEERTAINNRS